MLLVVLNPVDNDDTLLFVVLRPVDSEVTLLFVELRPVDREATPLFVVLLLVEATDLMFAVDSIPAVLAITHDPFIVYTSNIFAILGLRSIFFALSGIIQLFQYLQYGLAAILVFVGVKMLLADVYKIPVTIALGVVASILAVSVIASIAWPPKEKGIHLSVDPVVKKDPANPA